MGVQPDLVSEPAQAGTNVDNDLDRYLRNRAEYLDKLYHNEWTDSQIAELREKASHAAKRARKIKEEWGMI